MNLPFTRAIFWDFGGVLAESPFVAMREYERARGLPENFLRMNNADNPDANAWARFERGEIDQATFDRLFREETGKKGFPVSGCDILPLLAVPPRPAMVAVLRTLSGRYLNACLTNNLPIGQSAGMSLDVAHAAAINEVMSLFDLVLESSKAGCRKPEQRFFQIACEKLGILPSQVVFLDDLGINLKPARAMGMHTIKVVDPRTAVEDLGHFLGESLPLP
jgi:putative hydrolase of the HAD superfamily